MKLKPGMVVHTCNLSTREAKVEGWLILGQPGLQNETCLKKMIRHKERERREEKREETRFMSLEGRGWAHNIPTLFFQHYIRQLSFHNLSGS
jgi:hypothetical protein